jgi:Spy/CpxP family protein refolding chaperone
MEMGSSRLTTVALILVVSLAGTVAFSQTGVPSRGQGGGMGWGARMLGFRADYLDLTDAQQAQINDILAKEKPMVVPLLQQLALGHQQMQQLEQASTFDETKARTLATQQSETMAELMVEKARIKSELMQVLTTEQKAKMAQFEARQQARLQKRLQQVQTAPTETAPN